MFRPAHQMPAVLRHRTVEHSSLTSDPMLQSDGIQLPHPQVPTLATTPPSDCILTHTTQLHGEGVHSPAHPEAAGCIHIHASETRPGRKLASGLDSRRRTPSRGHHGHSVNIPATRFRPQAKGLANPPSSGSLRKRPQLSLIRASPARIRANRDYNTMRRLVQSPFRRTLPLTFIRPRVFWYRTGTTSR